MAYDARRQRLVLFGGHDGTSDSAETWEWDGSSWSLRSPLTSPSARDSHAMAWDPVAQQVVLFGGGNASAQELQDTWAWDGSNWLLRTSASSPWGGWPLAMANDEGRRRLLAYSQGTWEWDGSNWSDRQALIASATGQVSMTYDADRGRVALFDGATLWYFLP